MLIVTSIFFHLSEIMRACPCSLKITQRQRLYKLTIAAYCLSNKLSRWIYLLLYFYYIIPKRKSTEEKCDLLSASFVEFNIKIFMNVITCLRICHENVTRNGQKSIINCHCSQRPWVRFWGPKIAAASCTHLGPAQVMEVIIIKV